jgi:acyl carrier protein
MGNPKLRLSIGRTQPEGPRPDRLATYVISMGLQPMPPISGTIYRSANGDRWHLIDDAAAGRLFVRHQPNPASGGTVTDIEVADFLRVDGSGPEYSALREILRRRTQTSPTADKIIKLVAKHLKLDDGQVTPESALVDDLHADSLDVIEIVMSLEDAFGLNIPEKVIANICCVKDMIHYIEAQTRAAEVDIAPQRSHENRR